jgi:peptidyl-prolyl cis-trans isomerase D
MFDAVRNNKRIVQFFLILITVPFAVWGVDAYFNGRGEEATLATVGKVKITTNQFREELRREQDQERRQNPAISANMLNSPQFRTYVLESMIDRTLFAQEAKAQGINVISTLQAQIAKIPVFQKDNVFSQQIYEEVLKAQGYTPALFEQSMQDILTQQFLLGPVVNAAFTPETVIRQFIALQVENREAQENLLRWQSFAKDIKVTDADVQQFYEANAARFTIPEKIRVEFVALERDKIDTRKEFSDAELQAWYDAHRDQFIVPEERRARHILLLTENADKEKVKAEAEALLAEVQKDPSRFAELAKTRSQDPGSSAQGGDLGFFRHEQMVKPFSDAAFALTVGKISGVVESQFGYHIIRLDEIKPSQHRTYAEARPEVEAELQRQGAEQQIAKTLEDFANVVHEQSDSLQPAAKQFNLEVHKTDWISRENAGPLDNPRLLAALFGDEVLKNGRNSEAVEVAPGILLSARLLEHKPATLTPLAEVKAAIVSELTRQKAQAQAVEKGEAALKALVADAKADKTNWGKAQNISRLEPGLLAHPESLEAIFRADAKELPAYVGVELPGTGYALYKVNKVTAGEGITPEEIAAAHKPPPPPPMDPKEKPKEESRKVTVARTLLNLGVGVQFNAYKTALRQRYKVEIDKKQLEDNPQPGQ